jgi:hypothetical protein
MGKAIVLHSSKVADTWSCISSDFGRATAGCLSGASHCQTNALEQAGARILAGNKPKLLGAHDYGNNLAIYWYLVVSADLFAVLSAGDLHLFQQQDLHTHVTIIHRCLRKAVVELLLSFGQDPSQLEPKSKGFLGVT